MKAVAFFCAFICRINMAQPECLIARQFAFCSAGKCINGCGGNQTADVARKNAKRILFVVLGRNGSHANEKYLLCRQCQRIFALVDRTATRAAAAEKVEQRKNCS